MLSLKSKYVPFPGPPGVFTLNPSPKCLSFLQPRGSHNDRSGCSHPHSLLNPPPVHSLAYLSLCLSLHHAHTHGSRLQSSVSYWPSVSLPILLSVCVCVRASQCVRDPDGDGFIIKGQLLFLLLFYCCLFVPLAKLRRRGEEEVIRR